MIWYVTRMSDLLACPHHGGLLAQFPGYGIGYQRQTEPSLSVDEQDGGTRWGLCLNQRQREPAFCAAGAQLRCEKGDRAGMREYRRLLWCGNLELFTVVSPISYAPCEALPFLVWHG